MYFGGCEILLHLTRLTSMYFRSGLYNSYKIVNKCPEYKTHIENLCLATGQSPWTFLETNQSQNSVLTRALSSGGKTFERTFDEETRVWLSKVSQFPLYSSSNYGLKFREYKSAKLNQAF